MPSNDLGTTLARPTNRNSSISIGAMTTLNSNVLPISIDGVFMKALVDTGASISCISMSQLSKLPSLPKLQKSNISHVRGVGGEILDVVGCIELNVNIQNCIVLQKFHVFQRLHFSIILGMDFLDNNDVILDFSQKIITLPNCQTVNFLSSTTFDIGIARASKPFTIQPNCITNIPVHLSRVPHNALCLLEPVTSLHHVTSARVLLKARKGRGVCQLINHTNIPIHLHPKQIVGKLFPVDVNLIEPLEDSTNGQCYTRATSSKTNKEKAEDLGISLDDADLTEINKTKLLEFIGKNRDVFAKDMTELGQTSVHQHRINTGTARPTRQQFYRASPTMKNEIEKQTKEMLHDDIIEPSTSPWNSPVVLVKKSNGEMRFCVDYRRLNSVTEPECFPLPRLEDVFDTIGNSKAKIFSVLDLRSGFWQIPLDPETKHKTAFVTHHGIFQFKRLPFGLQNAPTTFQMLMTQVLQGLNWKFVLVYVDDILLLSDTFENHLQHLQLVFDRLRSANLKLKPSKCKFALQKVNYLGHIISKDGIEVNPEKIAVVKSFPIPKNQKQVRSFLGLCNYYRRFILGYSKITHPLNQLLHKNKPFKWTSECTTAFEKLKNALISPPILALPDTAKEFILSTDASSTAIGFVLSQADTEGRERAIAYGGRSLRGAEFKWDVSERECLALVEGI